MNFVLPATNASSMWKECYSWKMVSDNWSFICWRRPRYLFPLTFNLKKS